MRFVIKLAPVTKKNSQRILKNPKTGARFVAPSAAFCQYERDARMYLPRLDAPIDYPVNIRCLFYVPTRRRYDLTNLLEATDDLLVSAGVLADDNYKIVTAHDGSRVFYDKENPRTEIVIERLKDGDDIE